MENGRCSKFFPRKFQDMTIVDDEGLPIYRRRNTGFVVCKNDINLDNRYVVPYNPTLLLRYRTHLNVEWCNQSTSIKYLLKYINKAYERITVVIVPMQNEDGTQTEVRAEIYHHLDCRYLSPCEAC
jgi:hypothetical protein